MIYDDSVKVRAAVDPVFFIENYINIAGFPLLLRDSVADFINRLKSETTVTEHDLKRGEGLTTGLLGYVVWKAHTQPGTTHIISSPNMTETVEHLIHVAAMARSVSWEVGVGTVRKVGADVELQNGSRIIGLSARKPEALRGITADTFVCDGFGKLPEVYQAALVMVAGSLGPQCQTILV